MTFTPGNKLGKNGRPKGSPNKNIRDHAITGLTRGGASKAKKAGKNTMTNGLTYFFEDLAEKNPVAAAALAGKLISSEPPPETSSGITPGFTVNVVSAAQGTSFSPGQITLLPFDLAAIAWKAFNGGDTKWKAYLAANEALFTAVAFAKLSLLEVPEPTPGIADDDDVAPLRLLEAPIEPAPISRSEAEEQRVIDDLKNEINTLARKLGVDVVV